MKDIVLTTVIVLVTKIEASDDTLVSSTSTTIDGDKLQAAYDHSYAEYRKIDREQSDNTKVAKIKATFDKVNDFLVLMIIQTKH